MAILLHLQAIAAWYMLAMTTNAQSVLTEASTIATPTMPVSPKSASSVSSAPSQLAWANIGDSYSSGVAWKHTPANTFDGNADNCLRVDSAYTAQMKDDTSWANSYVNFTSCSGSVLYDMNRGAWPRGSQMERVGTPNFVTLTAGGNNLGFGALVGTCLFDSKWKDKVAYKDDKNRESDCAKALDESKKKLDDPDQFPRWVNETLHDLLTSPVAEAAAKAHDKFYIFWAGYPAFFNNETTYCNDKPMVNWLGFTTNPLSQEIRSDVNALVQKTNDVIQQTISNYPYPSINDKFARFVDVNPGFDGHRYCEPGMSSWKELVGPAIWLWNGVDVTEDDSIEHGSDATSGPATLSPSQTDMNAFSDWNQALLEQGVDANSDDGRPCDLSVGQRCRTLHPKAAGHKVYKEALITAIQKEAIGGVK